MILTLIGFLLVFIVAFGFNLIPFFGPSNLLIASTAAVGLVNPDLATLITIGVLVALGSTLAKGVQYLVTFFVSKHLSEKRRALLDADAKKIRKWAFFLLFISAATPIPDEPVVIPLGLMKYNPAKFFVAYLLGKLVITIPGAILGNEIGSVFSNWLSPEVMVVISIVLTIIITAILFKVDFGKLAERFKKNKTIGKSRQMNMEKIN